MRSYHLLSVGIAILTLTACGSSVSRTGTVTSNSTGSTSSTGTQTGASGNIYNLPLAPSFQATFNGVNGTLPAAISTVKTSRTLKVKITPLSAPNLTLPGYTDWVFPYGCLRVQVTVNGVTQTSKILKVSGENQDQNSACANAPTSQTLDFTNAMTGNGPATISISNAEYDNCRYGNAYHLQYNCSMSAIYKDHIVAATVSTQTDNTYMDP